MPPTNKDWSKESLLALGHLPAKTEDDLQTLEQVATQAIRSQEEIKWPRSLQYFENASQLSGNAATRFLYHGGQFGFHTFGVHDHSEVDDLVAPVSDNRLVRPVEAVMSMFTETRPQPRVSPGSTLYEHKAAAKISELLIDEVWENTLRMPALLREVAYMMCVTGTAAIEVEYNETDIPVEIEGVETVEEDDPLSPGQKIEVEKPSGKMETELKRDFVSRAWSALHLTADAGASSPEHMSWIARSAFEDVDAVKERFSKDAEGFFPERLENMRSQYGSEFSLYWWYKLQDILDTPQYGNHGGAITAQTRHADGGYAPNQTAVHYVDVKPTSSYPRGRTMVLAGGKLVFVGDARAWSERYPWRWHPYAFFHWFKHAGRFWGTPLLSLLVPLQKRINSIDSIMKANRELNGTGQWLVPIGSNMKEGGLSGIDGEHFEYNVQANGVKPEKVLTPPLGGDIHEERANCVEAIDIISGAGVVSSEISGSAARSGVILDYLRKEKMRSKSAMLQSFERGLEVCAQNILIEAQVHMGDEDPGLIERLRVAAAEHSDLTLNNFSIQSIQDSHSVHIDIASELLNSPEAKQQKFLEYMQYSGGQISEAEKQAGWKILGFEEFMSSPPGSTAEKMRRAISLAVQGEFDDLQPRPWDDSAVASEILQNEIDSERFHGYDPEVKKQILNVFGHHQEIVQAQQAKMMRMALAGGAGKQGE